MNHFELRVYALDKDGSMGLSKSPVTKRLNEHLAAMSIFSGYTSTGALNYFMMPKNQPLFLRLFTVDGNLGTPNRVFLETIANSTEAKEFANDLANLFDADYVPNLSRKIDPVEYLSRLQESSTPIMDTLPFFR